MGAYSDLCIDQGTDFETDLDLIADDGTTINVHGYVFNGQIRKAYTSANTSASFLFNTADANNGNVTVWMDSANTANIPYGRYVYDIKMTDLRNITTRVVEGILTINPSVSR
jgi:hypothetical protein